MTVPPPDELWRKEGFIDRVIEKLGTTELDYTTRLTERKREGELFAGVLVLFSFQQRASEQGQFYLHLIKRSSAVSQGGDLSCPGGIIQARLDRFLTFLAYIGLLPVFKGRAFTLAKRRNRSLYKIITLFFATALRETWEEIGLQPWKCQFLGPLPSYSLALLHRSIFPLVVLLREPWRVKLNYEVEKFLSIPLANFFRPENFARFAFEEGSKYPAGRPPEFPCFLIEDRGKEEILWGATFNILARFMDIVFDYQFPSPTQARVVRRPVNLDYITGRKDRSWRGPLSRIKFKESR